MAIYHQKLLNAYFIKPFYTMMLGYTDIDKQITLDDIRFVDEFYYNTHSGILGFMTLIPTENKNILVFEKSKWIRKQKLTSIIGLFLEFFS